MPKYVLKPLYQKKNIKISFIKKNLNGTPRKVLDVSLAKKYGWKSKTKLIEALKQTYKNLNKKEKKEKVTKKKEKKKPYKKETKLLPEPSIFQLY